MGRVAAGSRQVAAAEERRSASVADHAARENAAESFLPFANLRHQLIQGDVAAHQLGRLVLARRFQPEHLVHPVGKHGVADPLHAAVDHGDQGITVDVRHQRKPLADAALLVLLGEAIEKIAEAGCCFQIAFQGKNWAVDPENFACRSQVATADVAGLIGIVLGVRGCERDQQQHAIDRAIGPAIPDDEPAQVPKTGRQALELPHVLEELRPGLLQLLGMFRIVLGLQLA